MMSRRPTGKRRKLAKPYPKRRPILVSLFEDDGPFPGGTLQKLQEEGEQRELEQRQKKEIKKLKTSHTRHLKKLKNGQWEGLEKENERELDAEKRRQLKELEDLEQRHLEKLKELEASQRNVLLETTGLLNPVSYPDGKISEEEMAKCNLKDYKLSEVVLPKPLPKVKDLTVDVMVNDFLMPAFTLMNTETKWGDCGAMSVYLFSENVDPRPEFTAVLQGLVKYAEFVPPEWSTDLFQGSVSKEREGEIRGWSYLLSLCQEEIPFFQTCGDDEKEAREFVERMCKIMRESGSVEINGFKTCLIGYTYSFWLAKLYNKRGIEDEQLPLQLSDAKQHFMEYPWDPKGASDGFHYDPFPVNV